MSKPKLIAIDVQHKFSDIPISALPIENSLEMAKLNDLCNRLNLVPIKSDGAIEYRYLESLGKVQNFYSWVSENMKIKVNVKFNGVVVLDTPIILNSKNFDAVKNVALASALATINNRECLNSACEEFVENGGDEEYFDAIKPVNISGQWSLQTDRETDIIKLALSYLLSNLDDANTTCCTSTEDDDAIVINDNEQSPIREDEIIKLLKEV